MGAQGGAQGQPGAAPAEGGGQPAAQQQPPAERPSLAGALGGRFGLGRKKSQPADQPAGSSSQSPPAGNAAGPGSLLEMTTELASFSSDPVDDSQFAVPAGFKKVEPDMKRGM